MIIDFDILFLIRILIFATAFYVLAKFFLIILGGWINKTKVLWQINIFNALTILLGPMTIMLVISLLLLYNPLWTLASMVVLTLLFGDYFKSYFIGIQYRLDTKFHNATVITSPATSGQLKEMGLFGLWINTDSGLQFINYKKLFFEGFTLSASSKLSSPFHINIVRDKDNANQIDELKSVMYASPFPDLNQEIKIRIVNEESISLRVNLQREEHHRDLVRYLEENHFKIINS